MQVIRTYKCKKCHATMSNYALESINIHRIKHGQGVLNDSQIRELGRHTKLIPQHPIRVSKKSSYGGGRKKKKLINVVANLSNQVAQLKSSLQRARKKNEFTNSDPFWTSNEWRRLRYEALRRCGRKCLLCGAENKILHVDHVMPRSKYPLLALDINNLQVLCEDCNIGKSNIHNDDWR